jgi:hypothetical protein
MTTDSQIIVKFLFHGTGASLYVHRYIQLALTHLAEVSLGMTKALGFYPISEVNMFARTVELSSLRVSGQNHEAEQTSIW